MKYAEVFLIKTALEALGKLDLPVTFEVAKNIRACNVVLTEVQELAKELVEKYADRDEAGQLIVTKEGDFEKYKFNDLVKREHYNQEARKIDLFEHDIKLIKIKRSALPTTGIDISILVPLIDTVIIDE
jgi:hypothetical protein